MPRALPLCLRFVIQPDAPRLGDVHRVSWIDSFRLFFKIAYGNAPAPAPYRPLWWPRRISLMSGSETTLWRCAALFGAAAAIANASKLLPRGLGSGAK